MQQITTITPRADSKGLLKISLQLIKSTCQVIGNAKIFLIYGPVFPTLSSQ